MVLLFYFNGFNSAIPDDWSDNEKLVAVEAFARDRGFRFLPTTIDYRRAGACVEDILARPELAAPTDGAARRVIFAGSSMGGWFARVMQLRLAAERPALPVEALAFNPAFDLGLHGQVLVGPQLNFVSGEAYEWTAADSARLAALEASVDYDAPLPFYVYADQGDEVVSCEYSARRHARISRFVAFAGGSHRFEHAREALADFEAASARGVAALEARQTS